MKIFKFEPYIILILSILYFLLILKVIGSIIYLPFCIITCVYFFPIKLILQHKNNSEFNIMDLISNFEICVTIIFSYMFYLLPKNSSIKFIVAILTVISYILFFYFRHKGNRNFYNQAICLPFLSSIYFNSNLRLEE